jgi:hypothetical protein
MNLKNILNYLDKVFDDTENPEEPKYDPVHVGGMIVLSLLGISVLFWLLWSLLVFGGGIQAKVVPFLKIVFTSATAADFGYVGYPFEMGVFEGWPTNVIALVISIVLFVMITKIIYKGGKNEDKLQQEAK